MISEIIITSLLAFGYCCTFWEGMIFEKVGNWLETKLPEYITKPLFGCFICCTFWVGLIIYQDIIVSVSAMGLNAILSKLFYDIARPV